jgi:carboxymethylenebutenolidase
MLKHFASRFGHIAEILCLALLIAACSPGSQDAPTAQPQVAPDTADKAKPDNAGTATGSGEEAQTELQREVVSERLPYAEVDDELVYGHFVFPVDMIEPLPAVIVIHEWWGLNDNIRMNAERLAAEGYIVLAVDLFNGKVADTVGDARQLMLRVVENPESATENIRHAYDFVSTVAGAPRIASLGWDFGGGWALNAALLFPDELDATVIYYGQVITDEEQLLPLEVPILGLFGAKDTGVSVASIQAFEVALQNMRKPHDIHIYPDAGHAFANPDARAYDAATADDAWQKTLEFLARNLRVAVSDAQ